MRFAGVWLIMALLLSGCGAGEKYPLYTPWRTGTEGGPGAQPPSGQPGPERRSQVLQRQDQIGRQPWLGGSPGMTAPVGPTSAAVNADGGDPVLTPGDPHSPYSADGYGYQRQGTTIIGRGGPYTIVGPTVFGPSGRACQVTGNTVFCN